jgi:hypothetical protein
LGLKPTTTSDDGFHATDATGARYRISGRIDVDDRHVDLGSRSPTSHYEWLVVVRFSGSLASVDNVWKISSVEAERSADNNHVLRLTDALLRRGFTQTFGILEGNG